MAYFDCVSGASGNMVLGALLGAGLPQERLDDALRALPLPQASLKVSRVQRGVLAATLVEVHSGTESPPERRLADVLGIIEGSSLSARVKAQARRTFERLAAAEGRVHGTAAEEVTFHEVGALDAVVDVVGACAGLEALGVEEVYCSPLPLGGGETRASHGTLPLPAPATLELASDAGAPVRPGPEDRGELVTPTGAAILTTLARFERPLFRMLRVGTGAGSREMPGVPNVLRVWLGEREPASETALVLLETNVDDMSPELHGYVMERLFAAGARDVWFTPIQMKKNRPATMICALVPAELEGQATELLLRETSTLGIRTLPVGRHEAERRVELLETPLGVAQVKLKRLGGRVIGLAPEYESCRRLAQQHSLPLQEVFHIVSREAAARFLPPSGGGAI